MDWIYDDGGRSAAGFKGEAGDCGVRAAAIATGLSYAEVYARVNLLAKNERPRNGRKRSSARDGIYPKTLGKLLEGLGFRWVPTMGIGTGCHVHLRSEELPLGRLVVRVSKHFLAVVDRVAHDTHRDFRGGTRCVYGYWIAT